MSATGLITIGAANDTTEIEAVNLSGNISSDSDSSGNENLSFLSNSSGGSVVTFASSGISLNAGTGSISASDVDFAAGSNNPSFLSDRGVSWNALTASGGTLTLAPITSNTALNIGIGGSGYNVDDATLSAISNNFTKVTIGSSTTGDVTIGGGEAIDLTNGTARTWDLEIIGGADYGSASFIVGSANTVTIDSAQALILDSASANITQTNEILGGGELELKGAGDVTLTNASNNLSILKASNSGNLNYRDTDAIDLGTITTAALTVNAGGALTDSGTVSITGLADLTGGTITINWNYNGYRSIRFRCWIKCNYLGSSE